MSSTSRAPRPATRLKVRVLERVPLDFSLPLILLQCSFLGLRCPAGKKCASSPVVATAGSDGPDRLREHPRLLLRLFADHGNVKLVAPSFTAVIVDELRGLDLPSGDSR